MSSQHTIADRERLSLHRPTQTSTDEGPGDKLLLRGSQALSDAELLAVLLRTGIRGRPVIEIARGMLELGDGLAGLLSLEASQLMSVPGVGPAKLAILLAAIELGRRCAEQPLRQRSVMSSPKQTRKFLQHHLGMHSREVFSCLFLDSQHRLLRCDDLFLGTLDGAAVYPREVAVRALQYRAAAVILAHNHPSGMVSPSGADRRITQRLRDALGLIEVRVLDHLIVGRGSCFSFAEAGLL
ncbi:MAG: DNA repair protein RadC [Congregibacter sp.]